MNEGSSEPFKQSKVSNNEEHTATVCQTHDNELSMGSESHYDQFQQQMVNEMISQPQIQKFMQEAYKNFLKENS